MKLSTIPFFCSSLLLGAATLHAAPTLPAPTPIPYYNFAGQSITESLAKTLNTTHDKLLGYHACSAQPGGCIELVVGRASKIRAFTLIDTACPSGSPSDACLGGYVVAARVDGDLSADGAGGVTLGATVRVGVKQVVLDPLTRAFVTHYALASKAVLTIEAYELVTASEHAWSLTATDWAGQRIIDESGLAIASGSSACAAVGDSMQSGFSAVGDVVGAGVKLEFQISASAIRLAGTLDPVTAGIAFDITGDKLGNLANQVVGWEYDEVGAVAAAVAEQVCNQGSSTPTGAELLDAAFTTTTSETSTFPSGGTCGPTFETDSCGENAAGTCCWATTAYACEADASGTCVCQVSGQTAVVDTCGE